MEQIIAFLDALMRNNNRPWFNEHKNEYLEAQKKFNVFAERIMEGVAKFDDTIQGLKLTDCTYKIHRDIRFSPNKMPFKTHMGVFVCTRGKKSNLAGYYLQVEPKEAEYLGGNMLYTGMYHPETQMLKSIRDEVLFDGKKFTDAIAAAHHFNLLTETNLKRVPNGYPKDHPYAELLKQRDWALSQPIPEDILFSDHLVEWALEEFRTSREINQLLNRCILFDMA